MLKFIFSVYENAIHNCALSRQARKKINKKKMGKKIPTYVIFVNNS